MRPGIYFYGLLVDDRTFYPRGRGDGIDDLAVVRLAFGTDAVDLVDMEVLGVEAHVQIATIQTEGVFFEVEVGGIASLLQLSQSGGKIVRPKGVVEKFTPFTCIVWLHVV